MKNIHAFVWFCILVLGLTGCITPAPGPRSQFYQLQPMASEAPAATEPGEGPVVRIGPLQVSDYLSRPQLVTRVGEYQVSYDELKRWAEPLDENILWVLTRNLTERIPEARILPFTSMPTVLDTALTVPVRISRLESRPDGTVLLQAGWLVIPRDTPRRAVPEDITLTRTAASASTEDLVAAQSELIRELSDKIAGEIRALLPE